MRLTRSVIILLAVGLCHLWVCGPASAHGVKVRSYNVGSGGVGQFGAASFRATSFGVNTFGVNTFGVNTFGVSPFGLASSGFSSFGVSPFGLSPFGASMYGFTEGATGVAPVGAVTYSVVPVTRASVRTFTFAGPQLSLIPRVPVAPGGGAGTDVLNEIKQIKERVQSLETDLTAVKKRLDEIKPLPIKEEKSLTAKEVQEKLDNLHKKYATYEEALKKYLKEEAALAAAQTKATDEFAKAPTDPAKKKAMVDAIAAYSKLKAPEHPTKDK